MMESNTEKFCHMKQLTYIFKTITIVLHKVILIGHFFHVLLTTEHSLTYNQNDRFAFFLRQKSNMLSKCWFLKSIVNKSVADSVK